MDEDMISNGHSASADIFNGTSVTKHDSCVQFNDIAQSASLLVATILIDNSFSCLFCRCRSSRFVLEILGGVHESVYRCYGGPFSYRALLERPLTAKILPNRPYVYTLIDAALRLP